MLEKHCGGFTEGTMMWVQSWKALKDHHIQTHQFQKNKTTGPTRSSPQKDREGDHERSQSSIKRNTKQKRGRRGMDPNQGKNLITLVKITGRFEKTRGGSIQPRQVATGN